MIDASVRAFTAVNSRRPRIVFTLHEFGQGGTDRVCAYLARGFVEAGFSVQLVVLFGGAPTAPDILSILDSDITVKVLSKSRGSRHLGRLRVLQRLVAELTASPSDLVVSTGNNINWLTALAFGLARVSQSRLVLKITNPILRPKDGAVRRFYRQMRYRRAFDQAAAILTLDDHEAELLSRVFPNVSTRINSVVNPYVTPSMLALADEHNGERSLVLSIGRLAPQKRFDLLIRAFAEARIPDARLVILGEGPERQSLEDLVYHLSLEARVFLPGYTPKIETWLRRARVFALSSRYEGLPAVVFEAMAANCPVITTDSFLSARSLVGEAEGCAVISDANPSTFAQAIEDCWRRDRPSTLVKIAERYEIARGVMSHVAAIGALLDRRDAHTQHEQAG